MPRARILAFMLAWLWVGCAPVLAAPAAARLPAQLAGWRVTGSAAVPGAGGAAAAMREFGLRWRKDATLVRGAQQLTAQAWLFADATGAYGAFTYLRPADGRAVEWAKIRGQAVLEPADAWCLRDHWVLHLAATAPTKLPSAAELASIAGALPGIASGSHQPPTLPRYLPRTGLLAGSVAYAEGPVALAHAAPWLLASQVGFDRDAEVAVGSYREGTWRGMMALISYPTPQIAQDRLEALRKAGLDARRTGVMLAIWNGPRDAKSQALLGTPHEHAVVTWTRPPGLEALPALILGIFALVGLIIVVSLAVGLATGGLRALLAHVFPRRFPLYTPGGRFTRLNLR